MKEARPSIELWGQNGIYRLSVDAAAPEAEELAFLFNLKFGTRDERLGLWTPGRNGPRGIIEETGSETLLHFQFTLWEFAEAHLDPCSSRQMAAFLRKRIYVDPAQVIQKIEVLDDLLDYGFIFTERSKNHCYWRIYSPKHDSSHMARLVPRYFHSASKYGEGYENCTPRLKFRRKDQEIEQIRRLMRRGKDIDSCVLELEHAAGRAIDSTHAVGNRLYRKWAHPMVLYYNAKAEMFAESDFAPDQELGYSYRRLMGGEVELPTIIRPNGPGRIVSAR